MDHLDSVPWSVDLNRLYISVGLNRSVSSYTLETSIPSRPCSSCVPLTATRCGQKGAGTGSPTSYWKCTSSKRHPAAGAPWRRLRSKVSRSTRSHHRCDLCGRHGSQCLSVPLLAEMSVCFQGNQGVKQCKNHGSLQ